MKLTTNQRGFTLIELIVVIVILGILAAIAIPKYLDMTENASAVANEANAKAIEAAIMMHWANALMKDNSATLRKSVDAYNRSPKSFFSDGKEPKIAPAREKSYRVYVDHKNVLKVSY